MQCGGKRACELFFFYLTLSVRLSPMPLVALLLLFISILLLVFCISPLPRTQISSCWKHAESTIFWKRLAFCSLQCGVNSRCCCSCLRWVYRRVKLPCLITAQRSNQCLQIPLVALLVPIELLGKIQTITPQGAAALRNANQAFTAQKII